MSTWRGALAVYLDRRMLLILGMGFASGLPFLLSAGTLAYWLARLDVDLTRIGLFMLASWPYALKFLWAPLVDQVQLPWLTRRLGRWRSWALASQLGLIVAIAALAFTDPLGAPLATAGCALAIAFLSATQDIAIDAYRIEILRPHEQGAGASATQTGYRLGLLAAGAGAIALSDLVPWSSVFLALAALVALCSAVVLAAPEPPGAELPSAPDLRDAVWRAVIGPLRDFARRPSWPAIFAFAFLYKFGDAVGGVMANPFYVQLGFSGVEIASITKVFGLVATLAGVFAGGALVARSGLYAALWIAGVAQALTNLLFSWQAQVGHDLGWLALAICADNVAGGLGAAAFVACLSSLCRIEFTATQYALLTSLAAAGRNLIAAGSGWLADGVGWQLFFVLTALLAIPGLALLPLLKRSAQLGADPVP